MNDIILKKRKILKALGLPEISIPILVASGLYFEEMKGIPLNSYWENEDADLRDEFFITANLCISMCDIVRKVDPINEWRLKFDVVYLLFMKGLIQNINSIDSLIKINCYQDALNICRTITSKVNLMLYFSFYPSSYDNWLRNPNSKKYIDANIRKELAKHNVTNFKQLYSFLSDLIHFNFYASSEVGLFEQGLFPEIAPIANKIYTISKMLFAFIGYSILSLALIDQGEKKVTLLYEFDQLYEHLIENELNITRIEHLLLLINEDRYWEKSGENKFRICDNFNLKAYRENLTLFYKNKMHTKTL